MFDLGLDIYTMGVRLSEPNITLHFDSPDGWRRNCKACWPLAHTNEKRAPFYSLFILTPNHARIPASEFKWLQTRPRFLKENRCSLATEAHTSSSLLPPPIFIPTFSPRKTSHAGHHVTVNSPTRTSHPHHQPSRCQRSFQSTTCFQKPADRFDPNFWRTMSPQSSIYVFRVQSPTSGTNDGEWIGEICQEDHVRNACVEDQDRRRIGLGKMGDARG